MGSDEVTLGKQWAGSKLLTSLSKEREFFGCLRRDDYVTVLYKQKSQSVMLLRKNGFYVNKIRKDLAGRDRCIVSTKI